ncbi:MAG: SseB family protein [Myxococcota bacterium]
MLSLAASDSTAHGSRTHYVYARPQQLESHLAQTRRDSRHEDMLLGCLLAGKVYVVDYEIILDHEGPCFELCPDRMNGQPTLAVYTSRDQIPAHRDPMEAEAMPFAEILQELDAEASVVLNPASPLAHRIGADELHMLRRVLATD